MKLHIGTLTDSPELGQYTQVELNRHSVDSELSFFEKTSALQAAVQRGDIAIAVQNLSELPVRLSEGLTITALSSRSNPADVLFIKKNAIDANQAFRLREKAFLVAFSEIQKAQMAYFRPDVTFEKETALEQNLSVFFQRDSVDAFFCAASVADFLDFDRNAFELVELYPKEFIPAAGQGVLAWYCIAAELPTRRIFKKIHQSAVGKCTNIERRVAQLLYEKQNKTCAAYCEHDAAGNYHISVAALINGNVKRISQSATTHLGLADRVVDLLMSD